MIEITREEFLTFALFPEISDAKEISWFKSNEEGEQLGIIIQIKSNANYDYLIYQKEDSDYILYPNESKSASPDYQKVLSELADHMVSYSVRAPSVGGNVHI